MNLLKNSELYTLKKRILLYENYLKHTYIWGQKSLEKGFKVYSRGYTWKSLTEEKNQANIQVDIKLRH